MKTKIIIVVSFLLHNYTAIATADLKIDINYLLSTLEIQVVNFNPGDCDVLESCTQAGQRKLLIFGQRIANIGNKKFDLGKPKNKSYFVNDVCHGHFHFTGFAKYDIYDLNCTNIVAGGKLGGCMINFDPIENPSCSFDSPFGHCAKNNDRQGISAGCADVYRPYPALPCQYVDITGIPDGRYFLKATINWDQTLIQAHSNLQESDYTNNTAYLLINIQGNSVSVDFASHSIPNNRTFVNTDFLPQILKNLLLQGTKVARFNIEAGPNVTIENTMNTEFLAGNRVVLKPGFHAEAGSNFRASIYCHASTLKTGSNDFFETLENPDSTVSMASAGNQVNFNENEQNTDSTLHILDPLIIIIHPNPTNDKVSIQITGELAKETGEIIVYNVLGESIYHSPITTNQSIIDLYGHSKGVYFVKVIIGNEVFVEKIVYQ